MNTFLSLNNKINHSVRGPVNCKAFLCTFPLKMQVSKHESHAYSIISSLDLGSFKFKWHDWADIAGILKFTHAVQTVMSTSAIVYKLNKHFKFENLHILHFTTLDTRFHV